MNNAYLVSEETLRQVLEALFSMVVEGKSNSFEAQEAITTLRNILANPPKEPVAFEDVGGCMSDLISRLKKHTTPGHPGIIDEAIEEIARLRNIEEAAVSACGNTPWQGDEWYSLMCALDKALKGWA